MEGPLLTKGEQIVDTTVDGGSSSNAERTINISVTDNLSSQMMNEEAGFYPGSEQLRRRGRKLASQAVIFHVWKQRNNLIHNATALSPATVFISLDRELRNLISSRRTKNHFSSLMALSIR
ncbi:hypothetical protein BRARA_F01074 [Brassica rapa]|uniref:Uncharacterized protein n=1 Tax=Brassica campestris TaxID=3711 RepID=A0A397YW98_BRACM|nr:hypothetical protein BRARA_F01074 [Brassica rapa]